MHKWTDGEIGWYLGRSRQKNLRKDSFKVYSHMKS